MKAYAPKSHQREQQASSNLARSNVRSVTATPQVNSILHLQRTIGNQAVQRLLHANTEGLEAGSDTSATNGFAHDFSRIPVHSKPPIRLQAKLKVNTPGDSYEQEADRVAEQVTSMREPQVQRACYCGGGCAKCQNEQTGHTHLQMSSLHSPDAGQIDAPPMVNEVLRSPGQPLDDSTRQFMEPRFGHDFSHVRVHTDAQAATAAAVINARAFTIGRDIVFGAHAFVPSVTAGRRLVAHELAHTLQQDRGTGPSNIFRQENESTQPVSSLSDAEDPQLDELLTQIIDRTDDNLSLRQQLDALPDSSSAERERVSAALDVGRDDLIGLLQRRIIKLGIVIDGLEHQLVTTTMTSSATDRGAESMLLRIDFYNRQLNEHETQLKPLLRWQTRQKISSTNAEIAMIDEELAQLPPVSDPNAPEAELLATRRAELIQQRKTLVSSLMSGAVEFKQFDPRWGGKKYGQSAACSSIKEGGCGPTSLAILLNYLYSQDPEALQPKDIYFVTPDQTAKYAATHGRVCDSGTNSQTMVTQVSTQWPGYRGKSITLEQATSELRSGNMVLFSCHKCTGKNEAGQSETYSAHIMVLSGVDDAGNVFNVLDPGRREAKNIETISKQELLKHVGGFWIVEPK